MSEQPRRDRRLPTVSVEQATQIIQRHYDASLEVSSIRPLPGGSINRVLLWEFRGGAAPVVAKLNGMEQAKSLHAEFASLRFLQEFTGLPVPQTFKVVQDDEALEGAALLMRFVPGVTRANARLSDAGQRRFEERLALLLVNLHNHHRDTFGTLDGTPYDRWVDAFRPLFEEEVRGVRGELPTAVRHVVDRVTQDLDRWLTGDVKPTLVHGDLWANNILVDDQHPDRPQINACIDGVARYCDPEYELAYLKLFKTVGDRFFEVYRHHHPARPGFSARCRVYWLKTMLRHVRTFGGRYIANVEEICRDISIIYQRH